MRKSQCPRRISPLSRKARERGQLPARWQASNGRAARTNARVFCTRGPLTARLRRAPSPLRCEGEDKQNAFSRRLSRPSFADHQARKRLPDPPPATNEGGGAPKGASNQCRVECGTRPRASQTRARSRRTYLRGARSPSGAPPRHLQEALASLSSRPRFLELPGANGRTLPGASAASTSQTGPSAGRDDAQNRPGAACVAPPAGTAPAPPIRSTLAKGVPR